MKKKESKKDYLAPIQRLRDIENGKVMPTMEEFFKLCIVFEIPEAEILLNKMYPGLYDTWNKEIDATRK